MDNKNIFIFFFFLLICSKIVANEIIPIHLGRFYTSRIPDAKDTIFLPVEQQYIIQFSVYRYVGNVKMIDNQEYKFSVNDLDYSPNYSELQYHPDDWSLYKYLVTSYKTIIPMYTIIYAPTDSISDFRFKKPIDVLYYMPQTISDNCFESFQSSQQTLIGINILKYMSLFKYYLQKKIEEETTIVSKLSGELLVDKVYVVILPCEDSVRIKECNSNTIFSDSSGRKLEKK